MLFYDSFFCSLPLPNSTYILSIYGQQECSGLFGVYNPLKTCWSPIVAAFEYNWWFWRRRTILLSFYGRGSSLIQSGKKKPPEKCHTPTTKSIICGIPSKNEWITWLHQYIPDFDFKWSVYAKAQFPPKYPNSHVPKTI